MSNQTSTQTYGIGCKRHMHGADGIKTWNSIPCNLNLIF